MAGQALRLRRLRTDELTAAELAEIRSLLRAAFRDDGVGFTDEDWAHAVGGIHAILEDDGAIVSHASVVPRRIETAGRELRTGYVEAVATRPGHERRGHASRAMRAINEVIRDAYQLGALSTAVPKLYERIGWERWRGSTWVRTSAGPERTPDDDGGVLALRTPASPPLDLDGPITCDWRPGDVW